MKVAEQRQRQLYCVLMEEIKERLRVLAAAIKGAYGLPEVARFELCWLELRMICELIGLSSAVAHGTIPTTASQRFQSSYKPDDIFRQLEKVHPAFFPCAVDEELEDGVLSGMTIVENGYLTKTELVSLYGKCGDALHRGRLKNIGKERQFSVMEIISWQNKIVRLLNRHFIAMSDQRAAVYVMMQSKDTKLATAIELKGGVNSPGWQAWYLNRHR